MNKLPRFHSTVAGTPAVSEGELDRSGVGSMRRRVVPPTSFGGHMPNDVLNAEQFDMEEAYTGTYFTDLVNGVQESHDLSPTAVTPIDHGPAASKGSQGRTKIFGDDEDKLLVLLG